MPSATSSGADKGNAPRSRDHNQGNQGRSFTPAQEAAVSRIRKCQPTAFYDILGLESQKSECSEADIKKAYRKQSLLTHPDKNGHEKADEAFKMVSRAFGILGDKEKREKYDKYGGDPDSRFEQAQAQNPFGGFAQRQAGRQPGFGGGGWGQEELSPEEMFARFFGGGGGPFGGGGGFGGPEFVFNFGGGPGIRVHQFGGGRPRRRPREAQANGQEAPANPLQNLMGLLPILLFFILPMITSLFSWGSTPTAMPNIVYDTPSPPQTLGRTTAHLHVNYFVNPADIASYTPKELKSLDRTAENQFVRGLRTRCEHEITYKRQLKEQAQGWFYQDVEKIAAARAHPMPSCKRLEKLGVGL